MANEFIIRKGFKSLGDSQLTGSLTISQNIIAGGTVEANFASGTSAAISGAFDSVSQSLASEKLNNTTDTLTGDLTVTGKITAQEFHTEFVSASIIYESGSTQFGNSYDDTHVFTGSLENIYSENGVTGSFRARGGSITVEGLDSDINLRLTSGSGASLGEIRFWVDSTQIGEINMDKRDGEMTIQTQTSDGGILFRPNNTDLLFLTGSSVGIGTTSPLSQFEVGGRTQPRIAIASTGTSGASQINFGDADNGAIGSLRYDHSDDSMRFTVNSSEYVRINSSGNVGIDTVSPVSKLEISQQLSGAQTIDYPLTLTSRDDNNGINQLGGEGVGIKFKLAGNDVTDPGNSFVGAGIAAIRETSADGDSNTGLGLFISQNDETLDEAIRISNSGNVGIGATSPNQKLEIRDTAPFLRITTTLNDDSHELGREYGGIEWYTEETYGDAPAVAAYVKAIHTRSGTGHTNGDMGLVFATGTAANNLIATERMRIESATGNVGIGTTSPNTKLTVASANTSTAIGIINSDPTTTSTFTNYLSFFGTDNGGTLFTTPLAEIGGVSENGGTVVGSMIFKTTPAFGSSTERMRITSDGRLGIGFDNPYSTVHIEEKTADPTILILDKSGNSSKGIKFNRNTDTDASIIVNDQEDLLIGYNEAGLGDNLIIHSSGSTVVQIKSDGNVGIGETSPFGKLHIKGSDTGVTTPSAQGNLLVLEDSENGLSILSSTAGAGYINFGDSDDNDVGMILYGHSSNTMAFWTNGSEKLRIKSDGNVGIGISNPAARLHVGEAVNVAPKIRLELNDSGTSINANQEYGSIQWGGNDAQGNGVRADIRVFGAGTSGETYMTFGTMPAGYSSNQNAIEKVRILSSGGITFNGDTAAANALDDYEEGTWTPVIRGSSTAGTYQIASHYSRYTKVGNLVTLSTYITLDNPITGGGSGYLQITGSPFTKAANTFGNGAVLVSGFNFTASYLTVQHVTLSATTILYLNEIQDDGTNTDAPISGLSAGDRIAFTLSFQV